MNNMKELTRVVSQYGLEKLLEQIHALVLLLDSNGRLTAWNPAFDPIRSVLPSATGLEEYIPGEARVDFRRRLKEACDGRYPPQWVLDFVVDQRSSQKGFNGLLLPARVGHALFIAEQLAANPAVAEIIERLNRQVKLFRIESEHSKKLAHNKQVEVEAVVAQAREVSNIDELTFLPNRRQIIRELQNEIRRAERYNSKLSVSILDVDHFKLVNDTYGHLVGDQVLRALAQMLRDAVRHPDSIGRYGGEEFIILLPHSDQSAAVEQAARLCRKVREAVIEVDKYTIRMTLSIGVAEFQFGVDNWHTLLSRADTAMYEAKRAGRDQWAVSKG